MPRTNVTFATCNLYNLHEPGQAIYRDSDGWSQEQYDKKIEWLSRQVRDLEVDVWGFQELWHKDSLEKIFTDAGLAGDFSLVTPPNHSNKSIVCAAAVKKDILKGTPEWIVNFPDNLNFDSGGDDDQAPDISVKIDGFSRPVLHFEIQPRTDGKRIHVYVCHFKSKRPTDIFREGWYDKDIHGDHREAIGYAISTIRRTSEATALRLMLTELMKGTDTPVVVLGDLNDGHHSNTQNILTGQPNYLFGASTGGADSDLYSARTLQQYRSERDVYYTHVYQQSRESLDHILVSQEFYDNSKKRIWAFKGMDITNDHLNDDDHKDNGTTDHGIVRASFEYRPA